MTNKEREIEFDKFEQEENDIIREGMTDHTTGYKRMFIRDALFSAYNKGYANAVAKVRAALPSDEELPSLYHQDEGIGWLRTRIEQALSGSEAIEGDKK